MMTKVMITDENEDEYVKGQQAIFAMIYGTPDLDEESDDE